MALELSNVKRRLQDHLQEGLLMVVGSGLSAAEGIPGMWKLAAHLKDVVPSILVATPDPAWSSVVNALDAGDNLEAAMGKVNLLPRTVEVIITETAKLISVSEKSVFTSVLAEKRELPFTAFVRHLFKAGKRFHLITPNYDRLIELATEKAGIGVDTRLCGYLYGSCDPKRSADAHRESYFSGRTAAFRSLPCLCVYKPHGSLDWYEVDGKLIRSPIETGANPMIITPGTTKYRESFRIAFDDQRNAGNRAAQTANRFLFIGYGFNDDHLEQYVCPNGKLTKPTVIITEKLTENAMKIMSNSSGTEVIALTAASSSDWTRIVDQDGQELIVTDQLWNLDGFNKGVL